MGPKVQLDKLAWQWAENTDPSEITEEHIETAYRTNLKACSRIVGHRNCKGNPCCLVGLGEKEWFEEIEEKSFHDIDDPEKDRREDDTFVGLKNLGATCYVNTFLQLWFHNLKFRDAIFNWRSLEDICIDISDKAVALKNVIDSKKTTEKTPTQTDSPKRNTRQTATSANGVNKPTQNAAEVSDKTDDSAIQNGSILSEAELKDLMPTSVCGHLQYIFSLLQFSNKRYIDPKSFIDCMGLDTAYQQDAQEFSKLFMSLLESQLSEQTDPTVKNLVQELFKGEYSYVTKCNTCLNSSERSSEFYELELNIKGHNDIHQCIGEFLEEEKLEGDNQYFCGNCQSKQNAARCIQLKKFPDVLNLQLLRFVYDRKANQKKKLNTFIEFPELIDLGKYLQSTDQPCLYNLKAVLIHRGPSAYSGHYIAHIRDTKSQTWYKFNDTTIEKMGGKNLQLGNEEDVEVKGVKKPKTGKGFHSSRNSYMLVYQRKTDETEDVEEATFSSLPQRLQKLVTTHNQQFDNWIQELKSMRDVNIESGFARQKEIQRVIELMPVKKDMPWEWIKTSWLRDWLNQVLDLKVQQVDHSAVVCQHDKLDPMQVTDMKRISEASADALFSKYSGGPRLKGMDSLCRQCVRERCRVMRMKSHLAEDHKVISNLLKQKNTADTEDLTDCYWVGKGSLKKWRKLAVKQIETAESKSNNSFDAESDSADGASNSVEPLPSSSAAEAVNTSVSSTAMGDSVHIAEGNEEGDFNQDILCEEHGNLSGDETAMRLIPSDLWKRFRVYFPTAPEFRFGAEPCQRCKWKNEEETQTVQLNKQMASDQKTALQNLYLDRNRPLWKKSVHELNVITKSFLEDWRLFLRDPTRTDPVQATNNSTLICSHSGFLYEPDTVGITDSTEHLVYIWPQEWETLGRFLAQDKEIKVMRVEEESGHVSFFSTPDVCDECFRARKDAEQKAMTDFKDAIVYVRKMTEKDALYVASHASSSHDNSMDASQESEKDPDFLQKTGGKRRTADASGPAEKSLKVDTTTSRRSSRHRKVRGDKEIQISSTNRLIELKVRIMQHFSAAPIDQHIWLNGAELKGNDKLLGELGVIPGSVLMLKIDEAGDEAAYLEDVARASQPEKGFQGTGLLGS